MPNRPVLAGQPVAPRLVGEMTAALERVCADLELTGTGDELEMRMVARKIIALAERGVRDAKDLYDLTMIEFAGQNLH